MSSILSSRICRAQIVNGHETRTTWTTWTISRASSAGGSGELCMPQVKHFVPQANQAVRLVRLCHLNRPWPCEAMPKYTAAAAWHNLYNDGILSGLCCLQLLSPKDVPSIPFTEKFLDGNLLYSIYNSVSQILSQMIMHVQMNYILWPG